MKLNTLSSEYHYSAGLWHLELGLISPVSRLLPLTLGLAMLRSPLCHLKTRTVSMLSRFRVVSTTLSIYIGPGLPQALSKFTWPAFPLLGALEVGEPRFVRSLTLSLTT
jgi:hypothetical protein